MGAPEILEREPSPGPVLTAQAESETRRPLCCWGPRQQRTGHPLSEGHLEEQEGGSEWAQQRGCLAPAGERWEALEEGQLGLVPQPPPQQQEVRALSGHRSAGRTSQNRFRCPVEGSECWEKSCGCLDLYLWCHCCHPPGCFGFLRSSLPLLQLPPQTGSPVDPEEPKKHPLREEYLGLIRHLHTSDVKQMHLCVSHQQWV